MHRDNQRKAQRFTTKVMFCVFISQMKMDFNGVN